MMRRQEHPTEKFQNLEAEYGSEGVAYLAAGFATGMLGGFVAMIGITILVITDAAASVGYYFLIVGMAVEVLSIGRGFQCRAAQKRHQAR